MLKLLFGFMYRHYIKNDLDSFADAVSKNVRSLRDLVGTVTSRIDNLARTSNQYTALIDRQTTALHKLTISLDKVASSVHTLESTNIASRLRTLESRIK